MQKMVEHLINDLEASYEAKESLRFRLAIANSTEILLSNLTPEENDKLLNEWVHGEIDIRSKLPSSDLTPQYTQVEMIIRLIFKQALEMATLYRPAVMRCRN